MYSVRTHTRTRTHAHTLAPQHSLSEVASAFSSLLEDPSVCEQQGLSSLPAALTPEQGQHRVHRTHSCADTPTSHMQTHPPVTCRHAHQSHADTPTSHMQTRPPVTCRHAHQSHADMPTSHMQTRPPVTCRHAHQSHADTPTSHMQTRPPVTCRHAHQSHADTPTSGTPLPCVWLPAPPGRPHAATESSQTHS